MTVHNYKTTKNSSDNSPSYLPDNRHSSDVAYWNEEGSQQISSYTK